MMHLGLVHLGYMPLWLPCVLSLSTKVPNPNQNAAPISTYAVPILCVFFLMWLVLQVYMLSTVNPPH